MRHNPFLLLALPILASATGCMVKKMCSMVYVPDGVEITVESSGFDEGEWTVTVDTASCTLTLPGEVESCTAGLAWLEIFLSEDGSSITQMRLSESTPASLDIEFVHEGVVVFSDSVVPTYVEEEPNGKGCGVVQLGTATISMDD